MEGQLNMLNQLLHWVGEVSHLVSGIASGVLMSSIWTDGEEKGRLDAKNHAKQEEQTKHPLPHTNSDLEDELGQDECPEGFSEHYGQSISNGHVENTGKLEEGLGPSKHSLEYKISCQP